MHRESKFSACEADIQSVSDDATVLPGNPYQMCDFCGKLVAPGDSTSVLEKLSGPGRFFCGFCLRQRHNSKAGRNVLVMSYRGLIAYLYYESYLSHRLIAFCEIEDAIRDHVEEGLKNPVFSYDPETFLWHVDFNRVGSTKKKLPIEALKTTVSNTIKGLMLQSVVTGIQLTKLEDKYILAIDDFYQKRSRPQAKKLLLPTLKGCVSHEPHKTSWDKHKEFIAANLLVKCG